MQCSIICAGDVPSLPEMSADFVICADGGLAHAKRYGIKPDLIVGDFDSYGSVPPGENVFVHPVQKDETDSFLAAAYGIARGYRTFVIYGALGGRLDHSVANLQLLHDLCLRGCRGTLVGADGTRVTAIQNETLTFPASQTGQLAVFSLTAESHGVTIKNMQYEADNVTLTNHTSLGASNAFCGRAGSVTVRDGILLVIWKEDL